MISLIHLLTASISTCTYNTSAGRLGGIDSQDLLNNFQSHTEESVKHDSLMEEFA